MKLMKKTLNLLLSSTLVVSSSTAFSQAHAADGQVSASPQEKLPRPKQYVVLSFDGSRSVQMWKETRELATELNIGLTVFVSGVHFLPATLLKKYYDPPGPKYGPGTSAIRKISDAEAGTIPLRIEQMEGALSEGIEIGSHAVGHFDAGHGVGGLNWSSTDWISEITQFENILFNIFALNSLPERVPGEAASWKKTLTSTLKGFRAPLLSTNGTLTPALDKLGFVYDGSEAYPMEWGKWPFKQKDGNIWEIPMAQIPIVGTAKRQVAMDYNFYAFDSAATPDLENSNFYEERWVQSLTNYFNHNYYGNRAPIHIGAHFDDYNGRAYFRGFFRFARMICHQPEVVCLTGSALVKEMEALGPAKINALQHGHFDELKPATPLPDFKNIDLKIAWKNTRGVIHVQASGKDAVKAGHSLNVHVMLGDKVIATQLGDIVLPNSTKMQKISVKVFQNGREILSSTRRADVRQGLVHKLEKSDREELLMLGDLPGAHGLPDTSGLLPGSSLND